MRLGVEYFWKTQYTMLFYIFIRKISIYIKAFIQYGLVRIFKFPVIRTAS